jgi:tripeptide aminopeptidase
MIAGHLDTVFPEGTDVKTTRSGDRIAGPGIGDDCRGLAVVLTVARIIKETNLVPEGTLYLVGNVGEEGPGNLRGVRHLLTEELKGQVDFFISVDGAGGAGITSRAVGSHRYTISFEGPGGHSYGAFGMTNPMHAMGRAIARIADLQVPAGARTTFNVGIVRGGTSVNTITPLAEMDVDMRSERRRTCSRWIAASARPWTLPSRKSSRAGPTRAHPSPSSTTPSASVPPVARATTRTSCAPPSRPPSCSMMG